MRSSLHSPGSPVRKKGKIAMNAQISLAPIIALLAGILILVQPRLLNFIVAIYLIIIGLLGLFGGSLHL
jgi:threonine/homoserine efflux transporter RhtA